MSKKNSTIDYWIKHYKSFQEAGISQREYCRTNDLCYWTFNKWKRQFDTANKSTSLQQLPVKYYPAKTEKIGIVVDGNIKVIVPDDFSENTLRKIMTVLRNEK